MNKLLEGRRRYVGFIIFCFFLLFETSFWKNKTINQQQKLTLDYWNFETVLKIFELWQNAKSNFFCCTNILIDVKKIGKSRFDLRMHLSDLSKWKKFKFELVQLVQLVFTWEFKELICLRFHGKDWFVLFLNQNDLFYHYLQICQSQSLRR